MSDSATDSPFQSSERLSDMSQEISDKSQFQSQYLDTGSRRGTLFGSFETIRSNSFDSSKPRFSESISRENSGSRAFPGLLEEKTLSSKPSEQESSTKVRAFTFLQKSSPDKSINEPSVKSFDLNLSDYSNQNRLPQEKSYLAEYEKQCMDKEIEEFNLKIQEKEKNIQEYVDETKLVMDEYTRLKDSLEIIFVKKTDLRKTMRKEINSLEMKLQELEEENFRLNHALTSQRYKQKTPKNN